jgi:antitoxin PrlF
MSAAIMNSKGRLTLPRDIRNAMGLTTGTCVAFALLADGTVILRAKRRSSMSLRDMIQFARGAKKVPIEKMNLGRERS